MWEAWVIRPTQKHYEVINNLNSANLMVALYCVNNIAKETINKVPSTKPATCLIDFMF